MPSGGTFKFGAPSTPPMSPSPQNSYSGSFVTSVGSSVVSSVAPSDSVSNVGSMLQNVQLNPVIYSGGAAGGAANSSPFNYVVPRYFGANVMPLHLRRLDLSGFQGEMKTPVNFVSGSIFKCHHSLGQYLDFTAEAHMQYLHVVDDVLLSPEVKDQPISEKVKIMTDLNKTIFSEYEMITTEWGSAKFYRNFRDMIVKPVVDDVYNGTLDSVFFRQSIHSPEQPLSIAVFKYWLAK